MKRKFEKIRTRGSKEKQKKFAKKCKTTLNVFQERKGTQEKITYKSSRTVNKGGRVKILIFCE